MKILLLGANGQVGFELLRALAPLGELTAATREGTLKDGTVLTALSSPSIMFPSAGKSGIKVLLTDNIIVEEGATTDVLLDFDAEESFVLRGNTIMQNGLLFKPVIKASIRDE